MQVLHGMAGTVDMFGLAKITPKWVSAHTSIVSFPAHGVIGCCILSRTYGGPQVIAKPGLQIFLQASLGQPELRETSLKLWHPEYGNLPNWICFH